MRIAAMQKILNLPKDCLLSFFRPHHFSDSTLPYNQTPDALFPKRGMYFLIPFHVPVKLLLPELDAALWHIGIPASGMPMPETSVHENGGAVAGEPDVRMPVYVGRTGAVAETPGKEFLPQVYFRSGVPAPDL